jgi:hypothetical protein
MGKWVCHAFQFTLLRVFAELQSFAQGGRAANCSETDLEFDGNVNGLFFCSFRIT